MSATGDVDALVLEALNLFHGGRDDRLTKPEYSRMYALCHALAHQVGGTPADLQRVTVTARARYSVPVTLKLCFDHWSELLALSEQKTPQPTPWVRSQPLSGPESDEKARVRQILTDTRERHLRAV